MKFENHELPDAGDLAPYLANISTQGYDQRGDVGDFSAFDWVNRLYAAAPEWRDRIDDAYVTLLTAPDPLPRLVLDQVRQMPVRSFLPRILEVLEGHCAELAARLDTTRTDGRTLLGSIVHTAAMLVKSVRPSKQLAHELVAFERPEDGWPWTFKLALPGDVDGLFAKFAETLQRLDEDLFYEVIDSMVAEGPPLTTVVFEKLGRGPTALRERVISAVRRSTDAIEQTRSAMAAMSFDDDPAMAARVKAAIERPNPWPELAARLGVDAGN